MSPSYRPVSQDLNISTVAGVKDYFPNLAEVRFVCQNWVDVVFRHPSGY